MLNIAFKIEYPILGVGQYIVPQYIVIQNCNNTYCGYFPQNKNYCVRKKFKFTEF